MNKLDDIKLKSILPPSIEADENIRAICDTLDEHLREITDDALLVLLVPRIDELPPQLLDELAWQFHVDFYDYDFDLPKKRSLIRHALALHKKKGTPAAIEDVCAWVFKAAIVKEYWEYGGEPYHFKVDGIKDDLPSEATIKRFVDFANEYKNVRSWLDELRFLRTADVISYCGLALTGNRTTDIYPTKFVMGDEVGTLMIGMPLRIHRKVEIK